MCNPPSTTLHLVCQSTALLLCRSWGAGGVLLPVWPFAVTLEICANLRGRLRTLLLSEQGCLQNCWVYLQMSEQEEGIANDSSGYGRQTTLLGGYQKQCRSLPHMPYQCGLIVSQLIYRLTSSVTSKLCSNRGLLIWLTSKRFSKHRFWPNMAYQCGLLVVSQHISWLTGCFGYQ